MLQGELVRLSELPSKGISYPDDIEIYIRPMTVKEEVAMQSHSPTRYYQCLLDAISIHGDFNKNDLLYCDVQFLDLLRRIITFDIEDTINITGVYCTNCQIEGVKTDIEAAFKFSDISFTDLEESAFNKDYVFSDETRVTVSPITVGTFMKLVVKYISNAKVVDNKPDISEFTIAYYVALVQEVADRVADRVFKDDKARFNTMFDYISKLYKHKDRKVLDRMITETSSIMNPIRIECPTCGDIQEVRLEPSMQFHQ